MSMQPLNSDDHRAIVALQRKLRGGDAVTAQALADYVAVWEPRVRPDAKERAENFVIVQSDGATTGVAGPRWIFHLLGLRHRSAHLGLRTPTGLIVLQRRNRTKADWPDALDMAMAGHVPQHEDGSDMTLEEGAWKEIAEEIGLEERDAALTLREGKLLPIGDPYNSFDSDETRNPPFFNAEVCYLFAATLTPEGLGRLSFPDEEVIGLQMVTMDTAWHILAHDNIASGLRYSLPRYLDWIEKGGADARTAPS